MPSHNLKQLIAVGVYGWHQNNFCRFFFTMVRCTQPSSSSVLCLGEVICGGGVQKLFWNFFPGENSAEVQRLCLLWLLPFCLILLSAEWFCCSPVCCPSENGCAQLPGVQVPCYKDLDFSKPWCLLITWLTQSDFFLKRFTNVKMIFEVFYFKLAKTKSGFMSVKGFFEKIQLSGYIPFFLKVRKESNCRMCITKTWGFVYSMDNKLADCNLVAVEFRQHIF